MLAVQLKFNWTSLVCKKKFTAIFEAYKEDKMANGISGNDRHESKYYKAMNKWWHQVGQVMKHVSTTNNNNSNNQSNSSLHEDILQQFTTGGTPSSSSKSKQNFNDRAIDILEKMAKSSFTLLKHFEKTNELLERINGHLTV